MSGPFTVEPSLAEGYHLLLEDGVVIAHSKSRRQVQRIAAALVVENETSAIVAWLREQAAKDRAEADNHIGVVKSWCIRSAVDKDAAAEAIERGDFRKTP